MAIKTMKTVGITGGIGSGKSTVCRVFTLLGVPVYDADAAARRLMETDPEIKNGIISLFGREAFSEDGNLNRALIASSVFRNEQKLQQLNAIVHPAVARDFQQWKAGYAGVAYVLREAAILFESGSWKDCDRIILVDAPEDLRISRVKKRDGRTEEEIRTIISRQWTTEKKQSLASDIINNNEQHLIIPDILDIHRSLTTPLR